jgi:Sulfotransferase family
MIISYSHNFIFVKSRKSGGTSVQVALSAICGPGDIITGPQVDPESGICALHRNADRFGSEDNHPHAADVRAFVGWETWQDSFTFAFVRNPWDLLVSRYYFDLGDNEGPADFFEDWAFEYLEGMSYAKDRLEPYVCIGGEIAVEFVGRYERLNDDFRQICDRLGCDVELGKYRSQFRAGQGYRQYYSPKLRDLVGEKFGTDLQLFGYKF